MKYIIILILLFCVLLNAQVSYNQEFQVNTFANSNQYQSDICSLSDGKFVVCWQRYYQDSYKSDIYAQIFTNDGSKYKQEFKVNSNLNGYDNYSPSIESIHDGKFIVCWVNRGTTPQYYPRILAQIYNNDGSKYGTEFQVNTFTGDGQASPCVTSLIDGKFVVCWDGEDQYYPNDGVHGQIFNADGSKYGEEFDTNPDTTTYYDFMARISSLVDGKFVVCYINTEDENYLMNIRGQIFNSDGSNFFQDILIKTPDSEYISGPTICGLYNEKFIICWYSESDIWGQLFNNDGTKFKKEFRVNKFIDNYQSYACVCALNDRKFVVCWSSDDQDGSRTGVFGQLFNYDGSRYGSEFQINDYVFNYQERPAVSALGDSNFVVCWESYNQDVEGFSINGKYYRDKEINHSLINYALLYPLNDATLDVTTPTLRWQKPSVQRVNFPWEINYTLYLDEDNNFLFPIVIDSISDTTYSVQPLTSGKTYFWKVLAKNIAGDSLWSSETNVFFVSHDATAIKHQNSNNKSQAFELYGNYPNPFNPSTTIAFEVAQPVHVLLKIFDLQGRQVATLKDETMQAGQHKVTFNAQNLASGVYFYHIHMSSYQETRKMLLLR